MMQQEYSVIISDTSCLILLSKIDEFDLLQQLANHVYITKDIFEEYGHEIPSWIIIKDVKDQHYQKIIELDIDKGEASAIALSIEFEESVLILDDLKGRKYASKLGLKFTGTLGLIMKAKQLGVLKAIKPIITKIKNTNFRFNDDLLDSIIKEAGEL